MACTISTTNVTTSRGTATKVYSGLDSTYQVVKAGSTSILFVEVDNRLNTGESVWAKVYNTATPTVGTTAPDIIIRARAGTRKRVAFPKGCTLGTSTTVACTSTAGKAGTTAPAGTVVVTIHYT